MEGVGKSSFGAFAPKPIFLMTRGETGLETLIDAGRIPETDHVPETMTWNDALAVVQELIVADSGHRTLVFDTLNGLERLCHEHVCDTMFSGDWGKKGFTSYMQGYKASLTEWRRLLTKLDELRLKRRMSILCLAHTKVSTFKNPEGPDFDRYTVDLHHETWGLTHKWADVVLFANFFVAIDDSGARAKAHGGQQRILYTTRHAAWDAKNRHGLPEEIQMGSSGQEAFSNFATAMKAGKAGA